MDLMDDLNINSYDIMSIIGKFEDEFDIDIFEDGLVNTIGEVLAKLEK